MYLYTTFIFGDSQVPTVGINICRPVLHISLKVKIFPQWRNCKSANVGFDTGSQFRRTMVYPGMSDSFSSAFNYRNYAYGTINTAVHTIL